MIKINYIKKNDTVFSCINTLQFLLLNIAGLQLIRLIYKMRCHTQLYKASICFKQVKGFKYILAEGLKVIHFFSKPVLPLPHDKQRTSLHILFCN